MKEVGISNDQSHFFDVFGEVVEETDWVADYHLLQSALDGPIIDAARKWHAAYRKAQNSNLMRAKEVEQLRSLTLDQQYIMDDMDKEIIAKDARIKELEALNESLMENGNDLRARCQRAEADNLMLAMWNKRYIGHIERLEAAFLEAKRCPTCNGKGMIRHTVMHRVKDRMEDMSFNRTCPLCSGKGEQNAREALEGIKEGGKDE